MKNVTIKPQKNPISTATIQTVIKTNTVLDEMFGGGLRRGQLVEIYGPYASGKTQFCFTAIVESKGKVIYVDSEGTFSAKRITQISKERGKKIVDVDAKILRYEPTNWREQLAIFHQLPKDMENVDLIIVDSLMVFFRESKDFIGRENLYIRQSLARVHLSELRRIAKKYGCAVIVTNQVVANPNITPYTRMEDRETGSGGHSVHHIPDVRLYFRKAKNPKRIAYLMDSSELEPMQRVFVINHKGIDDVSEEEDKEPMQRVFVINHKGIDDVSEEEDKREDTVEPVSEPNEETSGSEVRTLTTPTKKENK